MSEARQLLLAATRDPERSVDFTGPEWDLLIRLARNIRLLPRLAWFVDDLGLSDRIPERAAAQLKGALRLSDQLQVHMRFELERLQYALRAHNLRLIALKGCAYIARDMALHKGRSMADVDIMVAFEDLKGAETALQAAGWRSKSMTEYDEAYYRNWAHEVPPLVHPERGIEVDLHHRILPRTTDISPDPSKLLANAEPVPGTGLHTLCPEDMVLHAAVHLFHNGEIAGALRELIDIDQLLREFGDADEAFWGRLAVRAKDLGLTRPLYYAAHFATELLGTPVEDERVLDNAPSFVVQKVMEFCVPRALVPADPVKPDLISALCIWLLYVRSHWLRMPPFVLMKHLGYKLLIRIRAKWQPVPTARE